MRDTIALVKRLVCALLATVAIIGGISRLTADAGRPEAARECRTVAHRTCGTDPRTHGETQMPRDEAFEAVVAAGAVTGGFEATPAATRIVVAPRERSQHVRRAAAASARPHDPPYLHTFSLLI